MLAATLHAGLGTARRIGATRLLRLALIAGVIVPLFIEPIATHDTGVAAGLLGAWPPPR